MQQNSINDTNIYDLPAVINIENIELLTNEFKQLLSTKKSILTLDATKIESITTAGLQLIISLEKTMSASGGNLFVKNSSEAFVSALKDEGLENLYQQNLGDGNQNG